MDKKTRRVTAEDEKYIIQNWDNMSKQEMAEKTKLTTRQVAAIITKYNGKYTLADGTLLKRKTEDGYVNNTCKVCEELGLTITTEADKAKQKTIAAIQAARKPKDEKIKDESIKKEKKAK